jgi:hypothetical protein
MFFNTGSKIENIQISSGFDPGLFYGVLRYVCVCFIFICPDHLHRKLSKIVIKAKFLILVVFIQTYIHSFSLTVQKKLSCHM